MRLGSCVSSPSLKHSGSTQPDRDESGWLGSGSTSMTRMKVLSEGRSSDWRASKTRTASNEGRDSSPLPTAVRWTEGSAQSAEVRGMATGPDNGGNGPDREYDVCLSFAGEQRPYVAEVAEHLAGAGVRVFYDEAEQVNLSGKDLYVHLDYIYQRAARYCVLFASVHYASKVWPSHERASAQARALRENAEYILPVRFDDTEIPGLRATVGYLSASEMAPRALADAVVAKLGRRIRHKYLPPL